MLQGRQVQQRGDLVLNIFCINTSCRQGRALSLCAKPEANHPPLCAEPQLFFATWFRGLLVLDRRCSVGGNYEGLAVLEQGGCGGAVNGPGR